MDMEKCTDEVRAWMYANRLKSNEVKTEVLVIARKTDAPTLANMRLGCSLIGPKKLTKNLGASFDEMHAMKARVMQTSLPPT